MQPSPEASPRHRHPNGNHPDAPSPAQTGPYATSQAAARHRNQSSRRPEREHSAGGPSTGGRRRLAKSAPAVQPAPHLMLKPHLVKHTPQLRIRVRLGVTAARLLPPHIRPPRLRPIIGGSPIGSGERQQLGRSRRADRSTMPRHYGSNPQLEAQQASRSR
jgi:hypothetical protein